ncbi:MAG: hypothetical protein ACRDWE_03490, partial [Acidimicrobiales bacterium]
LHPSWLHEIGLTSLTATAPGSANGSATVRPATAASSTPAASPAATLKVDETSPTTGLVDVQASKFVATVSAVGDPCWVEVIIKTSPTPAYAGDVAPGSSKSFTATETAEIEMGSTSGRLAVTSKSGDLGATAPTAAPYRFTIRPSS